MPQVTRLHLSDPVPERALWPFLALTFGLAWGIFALFALFPDPIARVLGAPGAAHPLFILAVWAPAIAALGLVWRHGGGGVWGGSSRASCCGGCRGSGGRS
jgi:uncharacterized protein